MRGSTACCGLRVRWRVCEGKNHLPVMEALECLLGYDLDMRDVEGGLESDGEVAKVRHIVALLPKWGGVAREERFRDSKSAKSE